VPLLAPGLHYHAYYGLWSCFGAFAALASWLEASPVTASGVVLAIALLRVARTDTPQVDLGSEWYHRRAAALTRVLHADLLAARPSLPHRSRLYFAQLPSGVGMVSAPGYSAPVRVWYADSTLRGYLVSQYARRAPADTAGGDYFFESDATDTGHLHEIVAGAEDLTAARGDPDWRRRHGELGVLFSSAGDFAAAAVEFKKLVLVDPTDAEAMERVAACLERLGRPAAAAEWTARAAAVRAASRDTRP
jgi:hypothetical protein